MNKGQISLLVLLDLSAAFDTVDRNILMRRLDTKIGRRQQITVNGTLSAFFELKRGVPQGSCLGPLLFTVYTSQLFDIIVSHLPDTHAHADDTQLYISFNPNVITDAENALSAIGSCINDLRSLMIKDRVTFNDSKTELLVVGTPRQLQKITCNTSITVGESLIKPAALCEIWGRAFIKTYP